MHAHTQTRTRENTHAKKATGEGEGWGSPVISASQETGARGLKEDCQPGQLSETLPRSSEQQEEVGRGGALLYSSVVDSTGPKGKQMK